MECKIYKKIQAISSLIDEIACIFGTVFLRRMFDSLIGGNARARTGDHRLKRALLYQLSYIPVLFLVSSVEIIYKKKILSNLFSFFLFFSFA